MNELDSKWVLVGLGVALLTGACLAKTDVGDAETTSGAGTGGGAASAGTSGGWTTGHGEGGEAAVGGSGTGGSVAASGAGGGDGEPVDACAPRDEAPGEPVYDEAEPGAGECAGTTLAQVIAQIRAARPDLADVDALYWPDPNRGGDGSFIYAFRRPDGGFAVVFKRGDGDCPAGCTINDYWYFETGEDCVVEEVGEAHRDFEHCMEPDQLPRWGIPRAARPSEICGADLSAQDVSGEYTFVTCGHINACTTGKEAANSTALPPTLSVKIVQDKADLSQGTVTFDGTGEPLLDGQAFEATFERRSFKIRKEYSNLPAQCIEQWSLEVDYDFEGLGERRLRFEQARTPDCDASPGDYCKGQVSANFGEASPR